MNSANSFFKIVVLGEGRVGKTSMSLKFVDGSFDENQQSTINASYLQKNVTLSNNKVIKLAIWDTAGQQKYNAIAPVYYRDAYGAIIVYDITSAQSFDKVGRRVIQVKKWAGQLKQYADKDIIIYVAGNKCDMESMRKVKKNQAEKFTSNNNLKHFHVSAKSGQGINQIFNDLCEEINKTKFSGSEATVNIKGRRAKGGVKINIEDQRKRMNEEATDGKKGGCCS